MLNQPGEMRPLLTLPSTCFLCLCQQHQSVCSMLAFIFTPKWAFVHPRPPVSMWLRRSPAQHLCVLHAHVSWLHTSECPGCERFPLRPLWDVSACSHSVVSTVVCWGKTRLRFMGCSSVGCGWIDGGTRHSCKAHKHRNTVLTAGLQFNPIIRIHILWSLHDLGLVTVLKWQLIMFHCKLIASVVLV